MKVTMRDWLEPSTLRHPNRVIGPWEVTLTWREKDGRPVCSGTSVAALPGTDEELDTAAWRSIPIGKLVREAQRARFEELGGAILEGLDPADAPFDHSWFEHFAYKAGAWERRPGRPVELGEEHFREVAETYTLAIASARPPLHEICARWQVARPTASRWVARARREFGLLPETQRGRALGNAGLLTRKGTQGESR